MANRYVVLRTVATRTAGAAPAGTRSGPAGERVTADSVELAVEPLSEPQRADLARDPQVLAIAAPMPLTLIKPVNVQPIAAPAALTSSWGIEAVRAPASQFDGAGITVAVLDTGIDPTHAAFQGTTIVQKNFTTGPANDVHGHGTHCAGTIFGKDVDNTRIGIARNVKKALIAKVLGPGGGSSETLAQAMQWAINEGANVISMSLGIDFPGFVDFLVNDQGMNVNPATSMALEQYRANVNLFGALAGVIEAQGAFGEGCVIVAASGNESNRPTFEIAVAPPAASKGFVAVGALGRGQNNALRVAEFSNNQVALSAPGVDVISAKAGGGLVSMSGTSMATPHVAGVAALWAQAIKQQTGSVSHQMLVAKLIASGTTTPLLAGFEADDVGTGIVQAP
jgi:subtilisin family serine protease